MNYPDHFSLHPGHLIFRSHDFVSLKIKTWPGLFIGVKHKITRIVYWYKNVYFSPGYLTWTLMKRDTWHPTAAHQVAHVFPRTLRNQADGTFLLNELSEAIDRSRDQHRAATSLVVLENSQGSGKVLPLEYVRQVSGGQQWDGLDPGAIQRTYIHCPKPTSRCILVLFTLLK